MVDTAVDRTYHAIRNAIYERKYSPGFHLKEEELSAEFNISRTPVRQAIRRLVDEGLVVIKENRRSYVADVVDENIETLFDIVSMLESYSAGLAAKNITPEQLKKVKAIQEQLEQSDHDEDKTFLEANYLFHKSIHEASGSPVLNKLVQQVSHLPVICYLKAGVHTENETAIAQHREIIEALEKGDREWASLRMKMHTETVRQQYRELLNLTKS